MAAFKYTEFAVALIDILPFAEKDNVATVNPDIPKDWRKQTPEQQDLNDEWVEANYEAIHKIQEKWGWG